MTHSPRPRHAGLKVIGVLKLISGVMALAVGIGVFRFLGHDPGPHAERIVTHLGLDPHNHFIHEVDQPDHGDRPDPPPRHRVRHVLLRRAPHGRGNRPDPRLPLGRVPRHRRHRLAHPLRDLRDRPEVHRPSGSRSSS